MEILSDINLQSPQGTRVTVNWLFLWVLLIKLLIIIKTLRIFELAKGKSSILGQTAGPHSDKVLCVLQAPRWLSCSTAVFLLLVHVGPVVSQSCGAPGIPGIPGTHGLNGMDGAKGEKGDPGELMLDMKVSDKFEMFYSHVSSTFLI